MSWFMQDYQRPKSDDDELEFIPASAYGPARRVKRSEEIPEEGIPLTRGAYKCQFCGCYPHYCKCP